MSREYWAGYFEGIRNARVSLMHNHDNIDKYMDWLLREQDNAKIIKESYDRDRFEE